MRFLQLQEDEYIRSLIFKTKQMPRHLPRRRALFPPRPRQSDLPTRVRCYVILYYWIESMYGLMQSWNNGAHVPFFNLFSQGLRFMSTYINVPQVPLLRTVGYNFQVSPISSICSGVPL